MSSPCLVMNRVGSIEHFENPSDTRKLESSSYHALGACLRPYNAFITSRTLPLLKTLQCSFVSLTYQLTKFNHQRTVFPPECFFEYQGIRHVQRLICVSSKLESFGYRVPRSLVCKTDEVHPDIASIHAESRIALLNVLSVQTNPHEIIFVLGATEVKEVVIYDAFVLRTRPEVNFQQNLCRCGGED
ncbi:hypothetical protein Tco_0690126 [Tanacetum coccineum]